MIININTHLLLQMQLHKNVDAGIWDELLVYELQHCKASLLAVRHRKASSSCIRCAASTAPSAPVKREGGLIASQFFYSLAIETKHGEVPTLILDATDCLISLQKIKTMSKLLNTIQHCSCLDRPPLQQCARLSLPEDGNESSSETRPSAVYTEGCHLFLLWQTIPRSLQNIWQPISSCLD